MLDGRLDVTGAADVIPAAQVDGKLDADHLLPKLACSLQSIRATRAVPTYQGSKTSRLVGVFAGVSLL